MTQETWKMELLMWLLLAGRVLASLMPYIVGIAGGLIVMYFVPPDTPVAGELLVSATVAIGLATGIKGQASAK